MTPKEFKAWFEGFTEAMDGQPTPAQWAKVKERVAQIDGRSTTYPVYVDRYWPRACPWWEMPRYEYMAAQDNTVLLCAQSKAAGSTGMAFDPLAAMNALGKADHADIEAS